MSILAASTFVSSLEHIVGFLVVIIALTMLWILTAIIGRFFIRMQPAAVAKPNAAGDADDPSEEEVAAIAACLVTILGRRSRIVSIGRARTSDWNREGRREHFSSRNIR